MRSPFPVAASFLVSGLLSISAALAQFQKGETVYFNYVGETREARVVEQNQWGVKIEFRNALTGQYDNSHTEYRQPNELSKTPPADFDPKKYGNAEGALQQHHQGAAPGGGGGGAGGGGLAPGQIVTYMKGGTLQQGRIVKEDQYGFLIEEPDWQTGQFTGNGFTAYRQRNELMAAQPQQPQVQPQQPRPRPQPQVQPQQPANPNWNPNKLPGIDARVPFAQPGGGAPMTENEVLTMIRDRLGDPEKVFYNFNAEQRTKALEEVANEIRNRGTNFDFRNMTYKDNFYNEVWKYGGNTELIGALRENSNSAPKQVPNLMGNWNMSKTGRVVPGVGTPLHGDEGSLQIAGGNGGGTFNWNGVQGQWREATAQEEAALVDRGYGVILQNGRDGKTWLLVQDTSQGNKENVKLYDIHDLGTVMGGER